MATKDRSASDRNTDIMATKQSILLLIHINVTDMSVWRQRTGLLLIDIRYYGNKEHSTSGTYKYDRYVAVATKNRSASDISTTVWQQRQFYF